MVNAALLYEIADAIEANPESHSQSVWANRCGTAFCIAGHAMVRRGYSMKVDPAGYKYATFYATDDPHKREVECFHAARLLLDISVDEARKLFDGGAQPAIGLTVPQALRRIASGEPVREVWD